MDLENQDKGNKPDSLRERASEAALELMKQLITLGSGVLALTAAFIDKLPKTPRPFLALLVLSWISLITSLFFGLQTISAIVKSRIDNDDQWWRGKGRTYGRISRYSFLFGIGLFATFAFVSLVLPPTKEKEITLTIKADDSKVVDAIKQIIAQSSPTPPMSPTGPKQRPSP